VKTLILGLGNSLLRDDGAGLEMARRLHQRLGHEGVDLMEASVAGLQTLQLLAGYDRAIVIDSICDGQSVGEVYRLDIESLPTSPSRVSHSIGLTSALQWARLAGMDVPGEIAVFALTVTDPYNFGEYLTAEVERAIPTAVDRIAEEVGSL
jgi:hydrogenase maturation protease